MILQFLLISVKSIMKHYKQSVVAIVSMSSVLVCYVIFEAYKTNMHNIFHSIYENKLQYAHLIVEKKGKTEFDFLKNNLSEAEQTEFFDFLKSKNSVIRATTKHLSFQIQITQGGEHHIVFLNGYDVENSAAMQTNLYTWDTFFGEPLKTNSDSVLISYGLAQKLRCKFSEDVSKVILKNSSIVPKLRSFECPVQDLQLQNISESGQLNVYTVIIQGVYDGLYTDLDDKLIKTNLQVAQNLFGDKVVSKITILFNNTKDLPQLRNEIEMRFPQLSATPWQDHEVGIIYQKTMSLFNLFSSFVFVILTVITFFIVFNTLYKIIHERMKEFGLLLSIGFHKSHIYSLMIIEGQLLVLCSCLFAGAIYILVDQALPFLNIQYRAGLLAQPIVLELDFPLNSALFAAESLFILNLVLSIFFIFIFTRKSIIQLIQN